MQLKRKLVRKSSLFKNVVSNTLDVNNNGLATETVSKMSIPIAQSSFDMLVDVKGAMSKSYFRHF